MSAATTWQSPTVRNIPVSSIRKDGNTQHRSGLTLAVVDEYAALMQAGTVFPPITIWWDSEKYWLTDGFHRVAAAEQLGLSVIVAEIWQGTLDEAQWQSYSANTLHGLRRTATETQRVIRLALDHPKAGTLSNVELGKHLHIPETTIRRWRTKLAPGEGNPVRVVTRGSKQYRINTGNIGKQRLRKQVKARIELKAGLDEMKAIGSPNARRLLNIISNWIFASATATECLNAIELVLDSSGAPMG